MTRRLARSPVVDVGNLTVGALARRHRVDWHPITGWPGASADTVGAQRRAKYSSSRQRRPPLERDLLTHDALAPPLGLAANDRRAMSRDHRA